MRYESNKPNKSKLPCRQSINQPKGPTTEDPQLEKLPHGDDFRVGPKSDRTPRDNTVLIGNVWLFPFSFRAVDYRSKVLSLKLIHSMLQNAGPVFRFHPMFIDAIKKYLCVSLSKNGVSTSSEVFRLSLSIFVELLDKYKSFLKMQMEVFFRDIFLNVLESSSTSFTNKWTLMEALTKICSGTSCYLNIWRVFKRISRDLISLKNTARVYRSSSIDWLIDWLMGWMVDYSSFGWLIDWLIDWLNGRLFIV